MTIMKSIKNKLCATAAGLALTFGFGASASSLPTEWEIATCKDVLAATNPLATVLSGMGIVCGGDPFTAGNVSVDGSNNVTVEIEGVQPLCLYAVYWMEKGMTAATDFKYVGDFVTDTDGNANAQLRDIDTPGDITGAALATLARSDYGTFLFYSRGPYAEDTDNDGKIDCYNVRGTPCTDTTLELANPDLGSLSNGVQFITTMGEVDKECPCNVLRERELTAFADNVKCGAKEGGLLRRSVCNDEGCHDTHPITLPEGRAASCFRVAHHSGGTISWYIKCETDGTVLYRSSEGTAALTRLSLGDTTPAADGKYVVVMDTEASDAGSMVTVAFVDHAE